MQRKAPFVIDKKVVSNIYSIRIDDKVESEIKEEAIIGKILQKHRQYQSVGPKILILKKEDAYIMKIGIGDHEERSYIIYDQFTRPEEDWKITFNPKVSITDELAVDSFEMNGYKFSREKRNLISFQEVIEEIWYYLKNGRLSDRLSWHTY